MNEWNLRGRTVLITGATGGIGLAAAQALAANGAQLVLTARNPQRAAAAVDAIRKRTPQADIALLDADFDSLASVASAAREFRALGRPLHVLLNNAGLMNTRRRLTHDGHEQMFGVNFLAPYLLTRLLLPRLEESAPARIVHVSSNAHGFCRGIRFDDLQHENGFSAFPAYGHSKLANLLFSNELARRLDGSRISSNAMHPGAVATGIGTHNGGLAARIVPLLMKPFFRTPERGADTAVHLAASPEVEGRSGGYWFNRRPIEPKPWGRDADSARQLWDVAGKLVEEHI